MRKRVYALSILVLVATCVYGPRAAGSWVKLFPHAKHVDGGVECTACHPAAESENLKQTLLPQTKTCTAECHEQSELDKAGWGEIPARKSGFLSYSHKAHLALGKKCEDCHDPSLPQMGLGAAVIKPNHGICFECHDGKKQTNDCEDCHSNLHEERLTGSVKDPSQFKPLDHHPAQLNDHQFAARLDGSQCSDCHRQQDFCSSCHQGENLESMVHERNWGLTHPVSAQKNLNDCAACHDIGTFCTECHAERGIKPGNHAAAGWAVGGLHADVARRDIQVCASCHDADNAFVCSRCHKDTGVQGDQPNLNIHPSDFRSNVGHGYWHDDPGAACFSCHTRPPNRPDGSLPAGDGFCGYCHGEKRG